MLGSKFPPRLRECARHTHPRKARALSHSSTYKRPHFLPPRPRPQSRVRPAAGRLVRQRSQEPVVSAQASRSPESACIPPCCFCNCNFSFWLEDQRRGCSRPRGFLVSPFRLGPLPSPHSGLLAEQRSL